MGACLSSCRSSSKLNNIRVVHLNGYVEDFDQPISASQVVGDHPPKHFVCTSIQLLSTSSSKSLKGDTQLQPGQVYFMLPYSILQDDFSPVDLASVAKRLTAIAKTRPCEYSNSNNNNNNKSIFNSSQSFWSSTSSAAAAASRNGSDEEKIGLMSGGGGGFGTCRSVQTWKPMLDTINEKSFTRRSESDLQENGSLMSFTKRSESDLFENGSLLSFTKRSESDLHENNVDLCLQPDWNKTCKIVY